MKPTDDVMPVRPLESQDVYPCPCCGLRIFGDATTCTFRHEAPICKGFGPLFERFGLKPQREVPTMFVGQIAPPFLTESPPVEVDLTGNLVATCKGELVLMHMRRSDVTCLALFSDEDAMRVFYRRAGVAFDAVKVVNNGDAFVRDFPSGATIILDPHYVESGAVRFQRVLKP